MCPQNSQEVTVNNVQKCEKCSKPCPEGEKPSPGVWGDSGCLGDVGEQLSRAGEGEALEAVGLWMSSSSMSRGAHGVLRVVGKQPPSIWTGLGMPGVQVSSSPEWFWGPQGCG